MAKKYPKVFKHDPDNHIFLDRLIEFGMLKQYKYVPEVLSWRVQLASGSILDVPDEAFAEWFLNMIDQERGALIAAHGQADTADGKRIREIQAELDIYRGVVPTPVGYEADPMRVKGLVAELNGLLKKTAQA